MVDNKYQIQEVLTIGKTILIGFFICFLTVHSDAQNTDSLKSIFSGSQIDVNTSMKMKFSCELDYYYVKDSSQINISNINPDCKYITIYYTNNSCDTLHSEVFINKDYKNYNRVYLHSLGQYNDKKYTVENLIAGDSLVIDNEIFKSQFNIIAAIEVTAIYRNENNLTGELKIQKFELDQNLLSYSVIQDIVKFGELSSIIILPIGQNITGEQAPINGITYFFE